MVALLLPWSSPLVSVFCTVGFVPELHLSQPCWFGAGTTYTIAAWQDTIFGMLLAEPLLCGTNGTLDFGSSNRVYSSVSSGIFDIFSPPNSSKWVLTSILVYDG